MRGRLLVILCSSVGLAAALVPSAAATGFRDTFDAGREGWLDGFEELPAAWFDVGGHPGGHIVVPDDEFGRAAGETERWGGNRSDAYGGEFSFDARFDSGESGEIYAGFAEEGQQPSYFRFTARSGGPWRHYDVPMRASAAGWEATQTELLTSLSGLNKVIIGTNDARDLYIDNVVLAADVRRRLTIRYSAGAVRGRLKPKGGCAKGQEVTVYRKKPGNDAKVGDDKTSAKGRYSVREPNANGSYYATTAASFKAGAGNCLAAKSARERV